jgi:hypothetical protein
MMHTKDTTESDLETPRKDRLTCRGSALRRTQCDEHDEPSSYVRYYQYVRRIVLGIPRNNSSTTARLTCTYEAEANAADAIRSTRVVRSLAAGSGAPFF